MRKTGKTEKPGKTAASGPPVPPDTAEAAKEPGSPEEKPKRGRKPKAVKAQEEVGMPSETAPEADAAPQNAGAEESATADENVPEEAGENAVIPAEVSTASTQVVESPLKRMKQEFHRRSQVIRKEMGNIQNSFVVIGFQLHWIYENNMFRVLNYRSIYDYAEKECNIKRTTCCNLINIIENYAERDEHGQVIESIADCYRNYSASQLVAMLGMPEELKQQVTPDMSVRTINRLRKGEPEAYVSETDPVSVEEPEPVREDAEETADMGEETEPAESQESDGHAGERKDPSADDTVHEEPAGRETAQPEPENEEAPETEGHGAEEPPEETARAGDGTLAEIDSYSDFKSMADELDLIMKQVFSADSPVRVKIVCVQG